MSDEVEGTGVFIPEVDYWRWRLTIEERSHAYTRFESSKKNISVKDLERTIEGYKSKLEAVNLDKAKEEYVKITKEIEASIGVAIKDVIIDEYTFEIKRIINQGEDKNGSNITS